MNEAKGETGVPGLVSSPLVAMYQFVPKANGALKINAATTIDAASLNFLTTANTGNYCNWSR